MTNDYITKKIFRKYLSISIASMAAATIGMMIDGMVIGSFLGAECMAAFGIVSPLFVLFSAAAGIFSNGSISLCGQYIGKDQPAKVNEVFTAAVACAGAVSLTCCLICLFLPEPISQILGARGELIPLSAAYIRGLGLGAIPIILSQVLMAFTKTDGSPKLGLTSIVVMTIINIGLDFLNALVLHFGMFGMAMATSISYIAAALVCCSHFARPYNTLRLVKMEKPAGELMKILVSGFPNALSKVCLTARITVLNHILTILGGTVAITALSIQNSLNTLLGSVCTGVGATTLLISGIFYGEEDKRTLTEAVRTSIKTGVLLTVVVSLVSLVFSKPLVNMFGKDNYEAAQMAVRVLRWFLLSLPLYTINVVFLNYYQSVGNLFMANFMCICNNFLFMILFALLLSPALGTEGVWMSFVLGESATLLALTGVVTFRKKRFPRSLTDYLLLPEPFGVPDEMQLNLSLENDMTKVMQLSENVGRFCRRCSIDERRIHHLSLCIEEMAGNVVQYAFLDKKKHFMDIRVLVKGNELIFRLRDDGVAFNPLKIQEEEIKDPCKNIGIRLVKKISRQTDYRNTVGLNNLIVKL